MSVTEAKALADRIRTGIRSGAIELEEPVVTETASTVSTPLTLGDVTARYLDEYARIETRRPHAIRQFEIYIDFFGVLRSQAPEASQCRWARNRSRRVVRADLDAAFATRLATIEAARQAAKKVQVLLAAGRPVSNELRRAAGPAGRSTKGGHVALNRFKARARHFFNWAIAQGYRDDTPFKRHGVNVVRLDGTAETVRARRLQAAGAAR
jgi:hypothetical protein